MGTRGLTAVMADGTYRIAQYGQWDHYPSGQGVVALEFARAHLSNDEGREAFKKKLEQVRFVSDEEHKEFWKTIPGVNGEFVTFPQADQFDEKWPYFSRDHGAKILELVHEATGKVLTRDQITFASESLYCEWAYVLDLDKKTLEAYQGFNKKPLPAGERFADFPIEETSVGTYFPVRHRATFSLDKLPTKKEFLSVLRDEEEEEESKDLDAVEAPPVLVTKKPKALPAAKKSKKKKAS